MPPLPIHAFGIDTSVFVRLLTGLPDEEFRQTSDALRWLTEADSSAQFFVSNQVIGEAYVALQFHYGIGKAEAREGLRQLLQAGLLEPLNGGLVIELLGQKGGAGLVDRLIVDDYRRAGLTVLTQDRAMARLPGARKLM